MESLVTTVDVSGTFQEIVESNEIMLADVVINVANQVILHVNVKQRKAGATIVEKAVT